MILLVFGSSLDLMDLMSCLLQHCWSFWRRICSLLQQPKPDHSKTCVSQRFLILFNDLLFLSIDERVIPMVLNYDPQSHYGRAAILLMQQPQYYQCGFKITHLSLLESASDNIVT